MQLAEKDKQYIRGHRDLIQAHKYREFFDMMPTNATRCYIAEFIYFDAQVDFLPYLTEIPPCLFWGCIQLTSIIIPRNIIKIGENSFAECVQLKSVTIEEGVTKIGDRAFEVCLSLPSVIIPGSVTSIGDSAFYNCNKLTSIVIPESVTTIGDEAFYGCNKLTIKCYKDSYAEKYALEYDIPIEYI